MKGMESAMGLFDFGQYDRFGFDKEGFNREGYNRLGYNREGYDKEGYDINGINLNGISKLTGRDKDGYDKDGFGIDGFNRDGFDCDGYGRDGFDLNGFDRTGFDKNGYNADGYNAEGFNCNGFDCDGYNRDGYNCDGYNRKGFNYEGFNLEGFDEKGFDRNGYDKEGFNLEGFGKDGFNRKGFNKQGLDVSGFDINGFDMDGYNRNGIDREGYNRQGFDTEGYDKNGFNIDGYNKRGYDRNGYNKDGYDINGYDKDGYDIKGFNKTGKDREGYNRKGFKDGFNREGFDVEGYDRNGFDKDGFDRKGHDSNGYDKDGFDSNGYDKAGYDRWGFNKEGYTKEGINLFGFDADGYNILGYDAEGFNRERKSIDGYSRDMFDEEGYHIYTGYNLKGYNRNGFSVNGYDECGYSEEGYHILTGYNREGYDREGYNREGFNSDGFDKAGYNKEGFNREGYDKEGFNSKGFDFKGYDRDGFDSEGYDINGYNREGEQNPRLKAETELDFEITENRLEKQYFDKCESQIRGPYRALVKERVYRDYQPITRRYIDRWGFVQWDTQEPDYSVAEREVRTQVNRVLREPYFAHVNYSGTPELYIGKQAVHGWVTDWADSRAQYYYQYQVHVGNKKLGINYVRDIEIKNGEYVGYKNLFARETQNNDDILQVADERLQQIIHVNRKNKKIHDIVESIQQNQYRIITNDKNKSILVLGCAGSGKTMILMHKIRFIKYNNPSIEMEDFLVISPTDILGHESRELSRLLQIGKIKQFTTASFYEYAISKYLSDNGVMHDDFRVIDDGQIDTNLYDGNKLLELVTWTNDILRNESKEAKSFLTNEYNRLVAIENDYINRLKHDKEYFVATKEIFNGATKELSQIGQKDLHRMILTIDSQLKVIDKLANYKAIMELMLRIPNIPEKPFLSKRLEGRNIQTSLFYTRRLVDASDVESFSRAVIHKEIVPQNMTELFLMLQCFCQEPFDVENANKVFKEWSKVTKEELHDYINYINGEFVRLKKLSEKKDLLIRFVGNPLVANKSLENKELSVDTVFNKVLELHQRTTGIFERGVFDAFDFFDSYNKVANKRTRVSAQRGINKKNQYLFDSIEAKLGIHENVNMSTEITVSQAFATLFILSKRFGTFDKKKRYIYIDEFQDFSSIELQMISSMYPAGIYNLFGDVKQCINAKGISQVEDIPKELYSEHPFSIKENYRNAIQITQYVKKKLNINMTPVGLDGIAREVDKLSELEIAPDDRVALIVKEQLVGTLNLQKYNDYMQTREIKRGCINIIPLCMAKGLEFERVIVGGKAFSENEFYVACTRAIEELIIINNYMDEDLNQVSLLVKQ